MGKMRKAELALEQHWSKRFANILPTPALLVSRERVLANLKRMADFAEKHEKKLRPHLKTHKSFALGRMQLGLGAVGLTCAKMDEAQAFVSNGFRNILIAYPILGSTRIERAKHLLRTYPEATIEFVVDSPEGILALEEVARGVQRTLLCWIEIDSGLKRCGVQPAAVLEIASGTKASQNLQFRGLLTHAGHAYSALEPTRRQEIGLHEATCLLQAREILRTHAIECPELSVGSTPSVEFSGTVDGITELRPGNYIFNDMTQVALGVTSEDNCALRVLSQVVSVSSDGLAIIDAGAKTLALDRGTHGLTLLNGFGKIIGSTESVIERLSEEHGIVKLAKNLSLRPGDFVEIIPNHACPVVNLARHFFLIDEQEASFEELPVDVGAGVH